MVSRIEINIKKYLLYSLPSTICALALARTKAEIFAIMLAYAFTLVNQWLLVFGVRELLNPAYIEHPQQRPTKLIIFAFVVKMLILALGLYFSAVIMGKRVIIPVINYAVLIFVLLFSIEKRSKNEKRITTII